MYRLFSNVYKSKSLNLLPHFRNITSGVVAEPETMQYNNNIRTYMSKYKVNHIPSGTHSLGRPASLRALLMA